MPNGVLVKVGRVTVCVLSQNILDVNRNLSFASDSLRFSHPQPIVCDNPDLHFCEGLHLIKHPHCTQDPRPWVKTCNGLIYKRECQENTSPSARKAGFPRHPAPRTWKTLVGCCAPGLILRCSFSVVFIFA